MNSAKSVRDLGEATTWLTFRPTMKIIFIHPKAETNMHVKDSVSLTQAWLACTPKETSGELKYGQNKDAQSALSIKYQNNLVLTKRFIVIKLAILEVSLLPPA